MPFGLLLIMGLDSQQGPCYIMSEETYENILDNAVNLIDKLEEASQIVSEKKGIPLDIAREEFIKKWKDKVDELYKVDEGLEALGYVIGGQYQRELTERGLEALGSVFSLDCKLD